MFSRSPFSGLKTFPRQASQWISLLAGQATSVPGATRTVPFVRPTGIAPAALLAEERVELVRRLLQ